MSQNYERGFIHGKTDLDIAWETENDFTTEATRFPSLRNTIIPSFTHSMMENLEDDEKKINVFNTERGLKIQRRASHVTPTAALSKASRISTVSGVIDRRISESRKSTTLTPEDGKSHSPTALPNAGHDSPYNNKLGRSKHSHLREGSNKLNGPFDASIVEEYVSDESEMYQPFDSRLEFDIFRINNFNSAKTNKNQLTTHFPTGIEASSSDIGSEIEIPGYLGSQSRADLHISPRSSHEWDLSRPSLTQQEHLDEFSSKCIPKILRTKKHRNRKKVPWAPIAMGAVADFSRTLEARDFATAAEAKVHVGGYRFWSTGNSFCD